METYMPITYLNDFVFCPYSIYLHQVFDNSAESMYSAKPQQRGKVAHKNIDEEIKKNKRTTSSILKGVYVVSNQFGIYGKIDTLYIREKKLVESKYFIKTLYRGYYYQVWAQYFALTEMGYQIDEIVFRSIKDNRIFPVPIPSDKDALELKNHIRTIARFDFETDIKTNSEKCKRCIYASLCDKTNQDHVYS